MKYLNTVLGIIGILACSGTLQWACDKDGELQFVLIDGTTAAVIAVFVNKNLFQ